MCERFLEDYLLVAAANNELFRDHVKGKRLRRCVSVLANEFARWFNRITPLNSYVIENAVNMRMTFEKHTPKKDLPPIIASAMLTAAVSEKGGDLLQAVRTVLEENVVIRDAETIELFIGHCLWELLPHMAAIHNEHSGAAPPTGAGPPLGFHVWPVVAAAVASTRRIGGDAQTSWHAAQSLSRSQAVEAAMAAAQQDDDLYR